MRIYISVDMEGISGVTRWEDVVVRGQDYQRARSWLTADVNAAIAGARESGATEFVVEENHGTEMLTNVILDEIDPEAEVVRGIPRTGLTTAAALDGTFDAMFLVGHHAKVGDYPGICAHTIDYSGYADVRLSGQTVSEGLIFATIAAQHGVPTALISGDDVITADLANLVPGIETAVVKKALSRTGGRIIPPPRAREIIRAAARRATKRVRSGKIAVPKIAPPFAMEVELRKPLSADALAVFHKHPEFTITDDRTVAFSDPRMDICVRRANVVQVYASGSDTRY
jgi:D-amino peptidase